MDRPVILIVDDEKNIIKLITRNLMDDNYRILTAQNGMQGLAILKQENVDLVISDHLMPEMSGLEFLRKVKLVYPHIQTIMLTAQNDVETARKAVDEAGVYKYFLKPWDENELRFSIKQALDMQNMRLERDRQLQKIKTQNLLYEYFEKKYPGITKTGNDEQHRENQYT
ncbi:response regulator, partial [Desulfobacterales bacterium HSG17]|nr:response regulator [Desulfobacterales bacterium HSG17]